MEAAWRLNSFEMCGSSHKVDRLAVHVEDKQNIIFREDKEFEALNKWQTTLTAWLELNSKDEFARTLKYHQIPKYYIYDKIWVRRKRNRNCSAFGRLTTVSPKDSERFHLKLILNHIKVI